MTIYELSTKPLSCNIMHLLKGPRKREGAVQGKAALMFCVGIDMHFHVEASAWRVDGYSRHSSHVCCINRHLPEQWQMHFQTVDKAFLKHV